MLSQHTHHTHTAQLSFACSQAMMASVYPWSTLGNVLYPKLLESSDCGSLWSQNRAIRAPHRQQHCLDLSTKWTIHTMGSNMNADCHQSPAAIQLSDSGSSWPEGHREWVRFMLLLLKYRLEEKVQNKNMSMCFWKWLCTNLCLYIQKHGNQDI